MPRNISRTYKYSMSKKATVLGYLSGPSATKLQLLGYTKHAPSLAQPPLFLFLFYGQPSLSLTPIGLPRTMMANIETLPPGFESETLGYMTQLGMFTWPTLKLERDVTIGPSVFLYYYLYFDFYIYLFSPQVSVITFTLIF